MGILAKITTRIYPKPIQSNDAGHSINKETVLKATDDKAFSPNNPGEYNSIRTFPICKNPRYFTKSQADALKKLSTEKAEGARQSKRAYKSLAKLEQSDAVVHKAQRKYEGVVADEELVKLKSNAKQARHLHALRHDYARLGTGLDRAEKSASDRIKQLKEKAKSKF